MPAASCGQIAMAGQRHRPGKASDLVVTIGHIGEAEHIGRVDIPPSDGGHAHEVLAMPHRPHRHHRIVEIRFRSEIEGGVGVEDLQPAHQQHKQNDDIDPMRHSHGARMAIDDLLSAHCMRPRLWLATPGQCV